MPPKHFSMKKLGQRLQVHPASITNAMEKLVGADLVRREPDPNDGRSALIALTPKGRELALGATETIGSRSVAISLERATAHHPTRSSAKPLSWATPTSSA